MTKKRTLSPEHLAKLQAGRAAAAAKKEDKSTEVPQVGLGQEAPSQGAISQEATVTLTEDQFQTLMDRMAKLESSQTVSTTAPVPTTDQFGKPVGIIQRYEVDPKHYKDPREELAKLPELQRFAFTFNYQLDWDIDQLIYETKYGTSFADPKFTLKLWRVLTNDQGEPSGKRLLVQTGIFFEDPAASVKEAVALGIPITNANSREFLDQMRFLRYKQFLIDIFYPQMAVPASSKVQEEVINGKVYQVEAYNTVA